MSLLEVRGLVKSFARRRVVDGVDFHVNRGEIVGLLGPNGAGKTTSFQMTCGLLEADEGHVFLNEVDVTRWPMHRRSREGGMGYLAQESSVFSKLTVEQNILAILENREELDRAGREQGLDQLLDELHVGHVRTSLGISLSGGERRRVEIARSLAANPRFVLLDEPFAGVDPISVLDIQRIIRHLSDRGIGVFITDHNVRETLKITSRAYIIREGTIFKAGTPDTLSSDIEVRKVYLGENFQLY